MLGAYSLWVDAAPRPGWQNMAIDHTLLERAQDGESWLRLYGWDPPCLSFGRHEPAARRYDADRIASLGMAVVRRPTGGRAVWHARELTYAVTAPGGGPRSLRGTYEEIHRMLRDALATLGLEARLAPSGRAAPVDAGACFARSAGGEVMVGDRKVVGSAQLRVGGAFLQHGSVLLESDQSAVAAVSRGSAPSDRAAPLARVLGRPVAREEVAATVAAAAAGRWGRPARRAEHPEEILRRAEFHGPRFRSAAWTWGPAASA